MSIIAKESNRTTDQNPIPEGVHIAKCYAIYDIGTQEKIWQEEVKFKRQVVIAFEIPEERIIIEKDGEKKDLPRAISKLYTLSLYKSAPLRKDLEAWRGKMFTKEELAGFDLKNVAGKSCMLQIVHEPKKDGSGIWVNINSLMSLPGGAKHEGTENPVVVWSILSGEHTINDDFSCVPEWIKTKALACKEVLESVSDDPEEVVEQHEEQPQDDSLPF